MKNALSVACVLALTFSAPAQWGPRGCASPGPVGPLVSPQLSGLIVRPPAPAWEWQSWGQDPGRLLLFKSGVQVGSYDLAEGYYRPYDRAQGWGPKGEPPVALPAWATQAKGKAPDWAKDGVQWDKVNGDGHTRYVLGGRHGAVAIDRQAAHALVGRKELTDDSKLPHLTLYRLPESAVKQALSDLAGAGVLNKVRLQAYKDGDPYAPKILEPVGFRPGVYLQAPGGKELYRAAAWSPADALEAVRKADPNYRPDPPRPVNPQPGPGPAPVVDANTLLYIVGAAILALIAGFVAIKKRFDP